MESFEKVKGIKNVIGAIDCSHIGVIGQQFCNENYINRKGFPSTLLQAVCDDKRRFTNCYAGWPGSVHDARVFSNCDISQVIENDPSSYFPDDTHLVGDAAYPLTRYMLTPYKDNGYLTEVQKSYNNRQSVTRNIIERAFALLKGKFPRMRFINCNNMEEVAKLIISTCVLHNFCVDENLTSGILEDEYEITEYEEEVNNFICVGGSLRDAESKRDRIAQNL